MILSRQANITAVSRSRHNSGALLLHGLYISNSIDSCMIEIKACKIKIAAQKYLNLVLAQKLAKGILK